MISVHIASHHAVGYLRELYRPLRGQAFFHSGDLEWALAYIEIEFGSWETNLFGVGST